VKNYLTKESAEEFFRYDNKTGKLFWEQRDRKHFSRDIDWKMFNTRFAGSEINHINDSGYICVRFKRKQTRVHRIIWLMEYGYWPEHQIDHVNGDRSDNRIKNLRKATNSENSANRTGSKSNSGYKGVHFLNKQEKYIAYITKDYNRYNLGYFDTPEEAHAAYCAKAAELFGEYANFGT
jgi:hypothetical protein